MGSNAIGRPSMQTANQRITTPWFRTFHDRTTFASRENLIARGKATEGNFLSFGTFISSGSTDAGAYGTITGNVFRQDALTPAARRVDLFERSTRRLVGTTVSRASDGYFEFNGLRKDREYFAVAFDEQVEGQDVPTYRSEAIDQLVPA